MLPDPSKKFVATHWGLYQYDPAGEGALKPAQGDPDPSPIGSGMMEAMRSPARVMRPSVRKSFLKNGETATGAGRGAEPFVEVSWDEAERLVAHHVDRIRQDHGNQAIYGGSYGWASAGRFHHAQSQVHRFLNCAGGYTRSVQNYSYAAGDVILPHVIGSSLGLSAGHTAWSEIAAHAGHVLMFGGVPWKNAQINNGGTAKHTLSANLRLLKAAGVSMTCISPIRDDVAAEFGATWLPLRPNTDVALMLALCHEILNRGREDRAFLDRYTVGWEKFAAYILGQTDGIAKTPAWASAITEIPVADILSTADLILQKPTFIMVAWALQRADHGEQSFWAAIALSCLLGTVGLPGLGFGFGYGATNGIGDPEIDFSWPSMPQGRNSVMEFIPVARIADMLLQPGEDYRYNGHTLIYPDIRMVYWAGGNPFHHHQDLNKLISAWKKPEVIVVHEPWWTATARHADIVLPVTTQMERNDIACSARDSTLMPSHQISAPVGEARSDYDIFAGIAEKLGCGPAFTEGRREEDWLRHLYDGLGKRIGNTESLPPFDQFWEGGPLPVENRVKRHHTLLSDFRQSPDERALKTPSGRIELYSEKIAGFGYTDCPPHPAWLEPAEWLGAPQATAFPLHMISNQPHAKLHSQYDNGIVSLSDKIDGRAPVRLHPADAAARNIVQGDIVRIFNDRGACLAGAVLSDELRPGVIQLSTGAWYDPLDPQALGTLDKHGNPNVLTRDQGTSTLTQGPSAQSCLVEIEKFSGEVPDIGCFTPPELIRRT